MSTVFVTTYEVIGALELARAHYDAVDAARAAHWDFAMEIGGEGYRPSYNGGLLSIFFTELPAGWKKVSTHNGKIEAVPLKSTKAGKTVAQRISDLPLAPSAGNLASSYGYKPPHFPISEGKIYFPSEMFLKFPRDRIFLRLPRFAEDCFEPNEANLRAIPESEFMAAIEAHNAEARRRREAKEGGAA